MNARIYDPTIGRFLSADTIIPYMYNTQSFNRYSYVRNNPLKYIDPSGHWGFGGDDDGGWSSIGFDGGSVSFDQNGNYDVSYDNGSGFGYDDGTSYSHDDSGNYTTENHNTGVNTAGWDTQNYAREADSQIYGGYIEDVKGNSMFSQNGNISANINGKSYQTNLTAIVGYRALDNPFISYKVVASYLEVKSINLTLAHQQFFWSDNRNKGFFDDGLARRDYKHTKDEYSNFSRKYDGNILDMAIEMTNPGIYNTCSNNCQDYVDNVLDTYGEIENVLQVY